MRRHLSVVYPKEFVNDGNINQDMFINLRESYSKLQQTAAALVSSVPLRLPSVLVSSCFAS